MHPSLPRTGPTTLNLNFSLDTKSILLPNPVQVLDSYCNSGDFSEEHVGVFCCQGLAVTFKVCNLLSLRGVKGVIFPSKFSL